MTKSEAEFTPQRFSTLPNLVIPAEAPKAPASKGEGGGMGDPVIRRFMAMNTCEGSQLGE